MTQIEHVVVWDGRRNGPGGEALVGPRSAMVPGVEYVAKVVYGGITARIRALKPTYGSKWFTVRDVVADTGLTVDQINTCLTNNLQRSKEVERENTSHTAADAGRNALAVNRSRTPGQRYRFIAQVSQ